MREMMVRTISGALYISILLIAILTSWELFLGLFILLAILTMSEFLKLVHLTSYLSYLLLFLGFYFFSYKFEYDKAVYLFLLITLFVNLFLLKDILWTSKIPMFEKKKYITVIFYIIGGFVFLTLIPLMNDQSEYNAYIILGIFILTWANDTFAYLVGKNFGKHKLLERVSPKKTIEGFMGGMLGAVIAGFVIYEIVKMQMPQNEIYDLWIWLVLGVIISFFGTIGDLIQSKFKRQAGVKDSGIIMPGHGGIYDRLDSIIYASPFVYTFLLIVDYVS